MKFCQLMHTIKLDTVYRSKDEAHLLFLKRIRCEQPDRPTLEQYFEDRHWGRQNVDACVMKGLELAREKGAPFTWLTITNAGSAEVCRAALRTQGVYEKDLESGYPCDPNTKSDVRIIAKPGLTIRLSRNFDKQRGFVNGAIATIVESLDGNRVFTARLLGTGNMVLIHPMEENK